MRCLPCLLASAATLALTVPAAAQLRAPADPSRESYTWALGLRIDHGASYMGSNRRSTGARPVIGLELGRFTISTGGGGSLLDFDQDLRSSSGVTARLIERGRWRLSAGLRLGGGRKSGDDAMLQGLPDVRRTLRGRLALGYDFTPDVYLRSSVNQDLLGREGGATWLNTVNVIFRPAARSELTLAAGFTLADGTYMRSYFGVPAERSGVTTPLPAYRPSAGLYSTHLGLELKTALSNHWIAFGGLGYSQLQGPARRSPLTLKSGNYSVGVGLAWRN
ncbi:MipA/OmpV family protein [Comamonas faecalis]|uniref:MipA/OmpV family protein n=1 Tax=Comamonas faecalis TaxID=1387849 RepID=A0ABP7S442_9BURK